MINGKKYSWEDITITLPHGVLIDVEGIEYSDQKEIEALHGRGSDATGYGTGNYTAEGKVTLKKEEFDKMVDYAKSKNIPLYKLPPFPITVGYANEDQATRTDVLKACVFTKTSHSASQGDKSLKVEREIKILNGIHRDGLAPN